MPTTREKQIVEIFIRAYYGRFRQSYVVSEWPEEAETARRCERPEKAVEAIAVAPDGKSLALEHTVIEAFEGATGSDARFEPIISALKRPARSQAGYHIRISMHLDFLGGMKATDREKLADELAVWFDSMKLALPEGPSWRRPLLRGRRRSLGIFKQAIVGFPGLISFYRYPRPSFLPRLRKALEDKVPKLCDAKADFRILLLERRDVDTPNSWEVGRLLKQLKTSRELKRLNAVWLMCTCEVLLGPSPHGNHFAEFACVWPDTDVNPFRSKITAAQAEALKASK